MYTLRYTVATLNLEESKITEFTASSYAGNALKDGFSPFLKSIIDFLAVGILLYVKIHVPKNTICYFKAKTVLKCCIYSIRGRLLIEADL